MNGCDFMGKVHSLEELMDTISNMNHENSVIEFSIPGKGEFTLVLEDEDDEAVGVKKEGNPELHRFINESKVLHKKGVGMSTIDLLKSFSAKVFV
jgi:hypothetical protein